MRVYCVFNEIDEQDIFLPTDVFLGETENETARILFHPTQRRTIMKFH